MRNLWLLLCLFGTTLAQESGTSTGGEEKRYNSIGLADGNGRTTAVHAFNPNPTKRLQLTFKAYDRYGNLQPVLPANSGALSPLLVNELTVEVAPLATYSMITGNAGSGGNAGSIEVDASGEAALWQSKRLPGVNGPGRVQTQAFLDRDAVKPSYSFPYAFSGAAADLPEAAVLGLGGGPIKTAISIQNTDAMTSVIRLSGRDALLGIDLGSQDIVIGPRHHFIAGLSSVFPNLLTGNLHLTTEQISGVMIPFLSNADLFTSFDFLGSDNSDPNQTGLEMPFYHDESQDVKGFLVIAPNQAQTNYSGEATVTLLPDQLRVNQPFANGPGRNVYLANQAFPPVPEMLNLGWMTASAGKTTINGVGILTAGNAAAVIPENQPIGLHASFPFDGQRDWEHAFQDSYLILKRNSPGVAELNAVLLDENAQILEILPMTLSEGVTQIPASDFLDNAGKVKTVLLEIEDESEAVIYGGFLVAGELAFNQKVLDYVPLQKLSGPRFVTKLGSVYEAWQSDSQSCLGSQLSIGQLISYINDPSTCP